MMRRSSRLFGLAVLSTLVGGCASTGGVPRPFPTPDGATAAAPRVPGPAAEPEPAPATAAAPSLAPGATDARPLAPPPFPGPPRAGDLVYTALRLVGAPYRNGGADPAGFDCSGFTQYVFSKNGIGIPRDVREQFQHGRAVDTSNLVPGDLLFFATTEEGPSHVGISVGGDLFVHAPSSTGVVRVERFTSTYWSRRFLGARRVA